MEEAVSLLEEQPYVALRSTSPERGPSAAHRRRSTMGLGRRPSLIRTPFLPVDEADELLLRANEAPDCRAPTVAETVQLMKAHQYRLQQFAKLQGITGMSAMTLCFTPEYEAGYRDYIQRGAVRRTRICFLLGFIGIALYFTWEATRIVFSPAAYAIAFGPGLVPFGIGFASTFVPTMRPHMEALFLTVFAIEAGALIIFKPIVGQAGPVLPLLLLLIPVFGVTRVRFIYSCALGWSIFAAYIGVQLLARSIWHVGSDKPSSIFYQGLNYGMMVLGGMVSHYRQELLRRRNYALLLPFGSSPDCSDALHKPKFSKKALLHQGSLAFKHDRVEATFLRHWYLIDPFPFENPNAAVLHEGAFKVVRFSIATAIMNQTFLAIQDYRLLGASPSIQSLGYMLRFGVVDFAYLASAAFMFVVGKLYVRQWRAVDDGKAPRLADTQLNDVQASQTFAAVVVLVHTTSMATLLCAVVSSSSSALADVYLMGFINAVLFSHRSGFRVRHKYAVCVTTVVGLVATIVLSQMLVHWLALRYACYIITVLFLGAMISREEESLRRSFFILKSIRSLEFEEWFQTICNIQDWVRARLLQKTAQARRSLPHVKRPLVPPAVDTSSHLSQASKWGMYGECVHVALVALDLVLRIYQ
ncbi:hypothetical protein SDRG_04230 [Saprolegnia diclina VS20]|uniref:Uncharacterized protein n=1 Tax=Saprolegnia diclina (strain VS20) TaxID=1156394 RepID=T0QKJ3_SAPDV|nr:hypothetical protein SDRG_04230 [Saprolegnia diclina VS20]EQC38524.1 hypothetical protein SDRG_04230 [Saprolegnia diclina VS20]|eukprot:XP_008608116.1 hypothetical protein SDRG_04230 [Saprolegnia diclina VS20]